MFLRVYLDESASEHPYLTAGWAARPEVWDRFSAIWKAALEDKPKIDYFKMNDALGLKGPFSGWKEKERDEKIVALAKTLPHDDSIFGMGCHLVRSDFEDRMHKIKRKIYRSPYYFCIATTMLFSVYGECQIVGLSKIDFVLDRSKEAERMRRLFYSDIKPLFPRLGECTTSDDKITLALQAADLAAGYTRQLYEQQPKRIPGCYSLSGLFSGVFELHAKGIEDALASPLFGGTDAPPD